MQLDGKRLLPCQGEDVAGVLGDQDAYGACLYGQLSIECTSTQSHFLRKAPVRLLRQR